MFMGFWEDFKTLVTSPVDLWVGLTNAGCPPDMLPYKAPGEKVKCVPGPGYEVSKRTKLEPVTIRDWAGTSGPGVLAAAQQYYGADTCPIFQKRDPASKQCVVNWSSVMITAGVIVAASVALRVVFK